MSTFNFSTKAKSIEFRDETMWVHLTDGRTLGVPLAYFPRLSAATIEERNQFTLSGGGIGIHWDGINEDILVEGLLLGTGDKTAQDSDAA